MVKFSHNAALSRRKHVREDATNRAGGRAYSLGPKQELVTLVTTSLYKDTFYSQADRDVKRLEALVDRLAQDGDALFAAQAAVYARKVHGLRSITHALAALVAPYASGTEWGRRFYRQIIHRPDDMMEIMGFYWSVWGRGNALPNAMKRGFADALAGFDAYQLAKYRGGSGALKLVDVVNLVHPKSTEAIDTLMKGVLAPADTWETALSQAGKVGSSAKSKVWQRLLSSGKLGFFAAIRNSRNIVEQSPHAVGDLTALITNRKAVRNSLVLPFQIAKAIRVMEQSQAPKAQTVLKALIKSLDLSLGNVPKLPGSTLVALDTSGSMMGQPIDIGALFAAVLVRSQDDVDLQVFSDDARYLAVGGGSAHHLAEAIKRNVAYRGTNFHGIFDRATRRYDRILILSDMQAWMGGHVPAEAHWRYRQRFAAHPKIFTWDLAGHGTTQFPADGVYALSGWSDRVFDVLAALDERPQALIETVDRIKV